jgi:hypothetical protein
LRSVSSCTNLDPILGPACAEIKIYAQKRLCFRFWRELNKNEPYCRWLRPDRSFHRGFYTKATAEVMRSAKLLGLRSLSATAAAESLRGWICTHSRQAGNALPQIRYGNTLRQPTTMPRIRKPPGSEGETHVSRRNNRGNLRARTVATPFHLGYRRYDKSPTRQRPTIAQPMMSEAKTATIPARTALWIVRPKSLSRQSFTSRNIPGPLSGACLSLTASNINRPKNMTHSQGNNL